MTLVSDTPSKDGQRPELTIPLDDMVPNPNLTTQYRESFHEFNTEIGKWMKHQHIRCLQIKKAMHFVYLKTQKINIGTNEKSSHLIMGDYWDTTTVKQATMLFQEYLDMFAWSYKDLKGIPPKLGHHHIELVDGARPKKHRCYWMNPNYKEQVKGKN